MNALEIIAAKANPEGFPVPQKTLARLVVGRVQNGLDLVFNYGPVVFTVGKEKPRVHMYSLGAGMGLLRATAQFHQDVWKTLPQHKYLEAPILNPGVARLAERFGWWKAGKLQTGHDLYVLERNAE